MVRFFALVLSAHISAGPSFAADSKPAAPAAGHATEATLTKLLTLTESEKMMSMGADMFGDTTSRIAAQLPGSPTEKRREEFLKELKKAEQDFKGSALAYSEMKPALIKIYQDVWTESEAKELVAFYESPVGKKAIREMPNLMQRAVEVARKQVETHAPKFQTRIQDLVKKYYPELLKK